MNKYKLLNPSPILSELSEAIDDNFLFFEDKACVNYWKNILKSLSTKQYSEYISWNNIERYETIYYLEAIFLLLDLPTRFIVENKEFDLFKSATTECSDESIRQVFSTSVECIALERSYQKTPHTTFGDEMVGHFQVKDFIKWAIDKGFIEKIENDSTDDLDKYPLSEYNDYRSWAKVHNTVATLVALKLYDGKLKSTSSRLEDKEFYNNLFKELVPTNKDGKDKPKPKTLKNYIASYNKYKK